MKVLHVGFAGRAGAGKDSAADFAADYLRAIMQVNKRLILRVSFANVLKEISAFLWGENSNHYFTQEGKKEHILSDGPVFAATLTGKPHEKTTRRKFLQEFGEFMRTFDRDYWVRNSYLNLKSTIAKLTSIYPGLNAYNALAIYADVRHPNEVEHILAHGGLVIWIEREGELLEGVEAQHISEPGKPLEHTIVVHNNSTLQELESKVQTLLDDFFATHEDYLPF